MVEILNNIYPSEKIIDKVAGLYNTIWNSKDTSIKERILKHARIKVIKGLFF